MCGLSLSLSLLSRETTLLLFHGCINTDSPKESWQNELAYAVGCSEMPV